MNLLILEGRQDLTKILLAWLAEIEKKLKRNLQALGSDEMDNFYARYKTYREVRNPYRWYISAAVIYIPRAPSSACQCWGESALEIVYRSARMLRLFGSSF